MCLGLLKRIDGETNRGSREEEERDRGRHSLSPALIYVDELRFGQKLQCRIGKKGKWTSDREKEQTKNMIGVRDLGDVWRGKAGEELHARRSTKQGIKSEHDSAEGCT